MIRRWWMLGSHFNRRELMGVEVTWEVPCDIPYKELRVGYNVVRWILAR
jgi:hypothetical protein